MNRVKVLLIIFVILCSSCSALTSLERTIVPEAVYESSIQVGTKNIPLLAGKWKVIARGIQKNFFTVYLFQEHDGNKFSYIRISTDSLIYDTYGYAADTDLNRTNMHYVVSNANIPGAALDGWYINNIINQFTSSSKDYPVEKEAAEYIKSHNYTISNDIIKVSHIFSGKVSKNRFLRVEYYYNPEADGFAKSTSTSWSTSEWNAVRINNDPLKVDYIDKIKRYHQELHNKIKQGFND